MTYNRIVAKLGTNLLTAGTGRLDLDVMSGLVGQIADLHKQGHEVIVVSSGAIAAGKQKLGLDEEGKEMPMKQVLASVGQSRLMHAYEQLFGWHEITVAQALLTRGDLVDRAGYLNARNTLLALMELKVVCIVNENDVVSIDEIEGVRFGDNDNLSAMVANLVDADLLLLLTDIGGLYTADPHHDSKAKLIPRVDKIDDAIQNLAGDPHTDCGTGGMATKIEAARLATASGVTVVIAAGSEPDILVRLARGEQVGTWFSPRGDKLESKERWLLSGLACKGKVVVDSGAVAAVKDQKKSLLAAGVVAVDDGFQRGDIVDVFDKQGNRIGCGIANYSGADLGKIKGTRSDKIHTLLGYDYGAEVIHRNNLVLL